MHASLLHGGQSKTYAGGRRLIAAGCILALMLGVMAFVGRERHTGGGQGSAELRQQQLSMLLGHEWNDNKDYWRETPLDMDSNFHRYSAHPPHATFRVGIRDFDLFDNDDNRKLERENGVIVDSFGPAEAVASSKPEPRNDFNVRQEDGTWFHSANARNVADRHADHMEPFHPDEIESDQFVGERVGSSGLVPFDEDHREIQGARGDDVFLPAATARMGMYGNDVGRGNLVEPSMKHTIHPSYPLGKNLHHHTYDRSHYYGDEDYHNYHHSHYYGDEDHGGIPSTIRVTSRGASSGSTPSIVTYDDSHYSEEADHGGIPSTIRVTNTGASSGMTPSIVTYDDSHYSEEADHGGIPSTIRVTNTGASSGMTPSIVTYDDSHYSEEADHGGIPSTTRVTSRVTSTEEHSDPVHSFS